MQEEGGGGRMRDKDEDGRVERNVQVTEERSCEYS